jgi:uncharacterized protein YdaU (DUF1376 family)
MGDMNYFKHHIGDYDADTAHLTWLEDMAYTRLLRLYYRREKPVPSDINQACRLVRAITKQERDAVSLILEEFFVLQADGWHNKRCDEEIEAAKAKADANRDNGKKGGRPPKSKTEEKPTGFSMGSDSVATPNPQETLANSHKPIANKKPPNPPGGMSDEEHPAFVALWSAYPKRPGASRASTLKAFTARMREGVAPETMLFGVRAYAAYCQKAVSDPKHIKQPETFLGPGQHYLSDWSYTPPESGASHAGHQNFDNSAPAKVRRAIAERNARREAEGSGTAGGEIIDGEFARTTL